MNASLGVNDSGEFEARYLAFLQTVTHLRLSLHRYCSRMTGSVLDGEDIVQEALFQAYRKLDTFDGSRPLAPWLFRIAHNRCIDFLRRREAREHAEAGAAMPDAVAPADAPAGAALDHAVEYLVLALPPMERACVLLKDVLDYSLDEVAELVDSTVGGVKAALHRGRSKLTALPYRGSSPARRPKAAKDIELPRLLRLYVERFTRQDWEGVRELAAADARLRVADRFAGRLDESPYFANYERLTLPWRLAVAEIDGEPVVACMYREGDAWAPRSVVRLELAGGRIARIVDYTHCPWVLPAAMSFSVAGRPAPPSSPRLGAIPDDV